MDGFSYMFMFCLYSVKLFLSVMELAARSTEKAITETSRETHHDFCCG